MTPFELKTQNDLDVEWQRFANKWLFPWHQMKMEGLSFRVEDFRGGIISYGGIKFGDQQQAVFWQAIERYLKGKVHEVFGKWDAETKEYPPALRGSALEGTTRLLGHFVGMIMHQAMQTDQGLRGSGSPPKDVSAHAHFANGICIAEITRLSKAHKALLASPQEEVKPKSRWAELVGAINLRPGMFGFNIDLKKLFGWEK